MRGNSSPLGIGSVERGGCATGPRWLCSVAFLRVLLRPWLPFAAVPPWMRLRPKKRPTRSAAAPCSIRMTPMIWLPSTSVPAQMPVKTPPRAPAANCWLLRAAPRNWPANPTRSSSRRPSTSKPCSPQAVGPSSSAGLLTLRTTLPATCGTLSARMWPWTPSRARYRPATAKRASRTLPNRRT